MRALKLLERVRSNPAAKSELGSLTPQEQALYLSALQGFLDAQGLLATAKRLDAGGEWMSSAQALQQQRTGVRQYAEQERGDLVQLGIPGPDDVSAAHVCAAALSALTGVQVAQLRLGIMHGTYLQCTIVEPLFVAASATALLRDDSGALVSLSLYHCLPPGATQAFAQRAFPVGSRLTVKEPYLKMYNTGYLGLRVDNPCNLVLQLPPSIARDAVQLKSYANDCYAGRDVWSAARAYSQALDLQPAPQGELRAVLLSNRALTRLCLRDASGALEDCDAGLAASPAPTLARKLAHRRVKALLQLRRFEAARAAADAAAPEEAAALQQLVRTAGQQAAGTFDALTLPLQPGEPQADVATFVGPVEVRAAARGRGRGLFTTRAVAAHELLLVDRALGVRIADLSKEKVFAPSAAFKSINKTSQHQLISYLVLSAQCGSALLNSQLALLSTGEPGAPLFDARAAAHDAPPAPPVSALAIRKIVSVNTFSSHETCREPSSAARQALERAGTLALQAPPPPPAGGYGCDFNPTNPVMRACLPLEDLQGRGASRAASLAKALQATPAAERKRCVNEGGGEAGASALMAAAIFADAEAVKVLLGAGADPSLADPNGFTALHNAAAARGDRGAAAIRLLLEAGADVNCASQWGTTPLGAAMAVGNAGVAAELLRRGADMHAEDYLSTPLAQAVLGRDAQARKVLEQSCAAAGKPPLQAVKEGTSLWMLASLMNHDNQAAVSTSLNIFGELAFVRARRAMKAGEELTTSYSEGDVSHWGIKGQ